MAAGGQHRLHAVEGWTKILHKQYGELMKQWQNLEQQDNDEVTKMNIETENNMHKPKKDALQETLALGGQWMVILYDYSEYNIQHYCIVHFKTPLKCVIWFHVC